jgi:glycerol kinase
VSYILGIDEGTTSARTILFDDKGEAVAVATQEITQNYPRSGWIEHDPIEIVNAQKATIARVLEQAQVSPRDIVAAGVTNQRETALVWDRKTGEPIYRAIVWASRQSASVADAWSQEFGDRVTEITGLFCDAYYSASKIAWILDRVDGARERAQKGELCAGTIDSWLIWNFTKGERHVTEHSNAARTMIYDIHQGVWSEELCDRYGIPMDMLPEILDSDGQFGDMTGVLGRDVPITGVLGDQQAGLFGQAAFEPGMAKMTFGTAGVFTINTGDSPIEPKGVTASAAWKAKGKLTYESEGVNYASGKTIQWLRDDLKLIHAAPDSEWYSGQVDDTQGVYLVPWFSGIAAPDWDMYARGAIVGMNSGTNRNHIIRAGLESMAYQTRDVVDAALASGDVELPDLRIDGGAVGNEVLCQFLADILGRPVVRPKQPEATVMGATFMAGLGSGLWADQEELSSLWQEDRTFEPEMSEDRREQLYAGWREARELTKGWAKKVPVD